MRGLTKMAFAGALATAAIGMAAAPAHADAFDCNGTVDTNCTYCSSGGGNSGYDPYWCQNYPQYYFYRYCTLWAANTCLVG